MDSDRADNEITKQYIDYCLIRCLKVGLLVDCNLFSEFSVAYETLCCVQNCIYPVPTSFTAFADDTSNKFDVSVLN